MYHTHQVDRKAVPVTLVPELSLEKDHYTYNAMRMKKDRMMAAPVIIGMPVFGYARHSCHQYWISRRGDRG